MTDVLADAEKRYAAAKSRRARIEKAWKAEGSPLLGMGSKGQVAEHALMRVLRPFGFVAIPALNDALGLATVEKEFNGLAEAVVTTP